MLIPAPANVVDLVNSSSRLFHQIWYAKTAGPPQTYIGPTKYIERMGQFSTFNPNWRHILWTNNTIDWLLDLPENAPYKAIFNKMIHPIQKADVARLVILYNYGGVYADLDFYHVNSLDPLLQDMTTEEAVFFMEHFRTKRRIFSSAQCIMNGCIVAKPHATILHELILHIGDTLQQHNPETEVINLTGPRCLHKYLYGSIREGVKPKWKIREFDGHNQGRVRNRSREYMEQFVHVNHGDTSEHSGWASDIITSNVWYYGVKFCAWIILILVICCAVLYFFSPYTGIWRHNFYCYPCITKKFPKYLTK